MAEETLVKEPLTTEMIASGQAMVERLDAEDFNAISAFWLFRSESNRWYFVVASPKVQKEGARKAYVRILKVLKKMPAGDGSIPIFGVKAIPSTDPLVKSVRKLLRSARRVQNGNAGVRFKRNRIADTYIEDAYVYRAA